MADPDQMSGEELFKAKERVEQQLERLSYRPPGSFRSYAPTGKPGLKSELNQILDEINAELAELDSKNA